MLDNTDAFMDDDAEDEEEKHDNEEKQSSVVPKWQAAIQEKRRITLERVNGCGDALIAKAKVDEVEVEEKEHEEEEVGVENEEEEEEKSRSDNRTDKKKNVVRVLFGFTY